MDDLTRLAVAARHGDRVALEAFVRGSQSDVWKLCSYLVSPDAADDLTQETFLRAVPALARFKGESSARVWLLSIARRVCADAIRAISRGRRLVERTSDPDEEATPSASGLVELYDLIAQLDDDRREAFVLTQILGVSYAEAADACDCPVGTIRSRVARARSILSDAITEPETAVQIVNES